MTAPIEQARRLLRKDGEAPSKRDLDRALVFTLVAIVETLKEIAGAIEDLRRPRESWE